MKKIGFLFDMDGVLYEKSKHFISQAKKVVFNELGLNYNIWCQRARGIPLADQVVWYEKETNKPFPLSVAEFSQKAFAGEKELIIHYYANTKPIFLDFVTSIPKNVPQGVVTSSTYERAESILTLLGYVPHHFTKETIVSCEDVKTGKPAPDAYLLGCQKIGCEPKNCIVFEDAPAGVKSALAANVKYIVGYSSCANTRDQLKEAGAHLVLDDLESLTFSKLQNKIN